MNCALPCSSLLMNTITIILIKYNKMTWIRSTRYTHTETHNYSHTHPHVHPHTHTYTYTHSYSHTHMCIHTTHRDHGQLWCVLAGWCCMMGPVGHLTWIWTREIHGFRIQIVLNSFSQILPTQGTVHISRLLLSVDVGHAVYRVYIRLFSLERSPLPCVCRLGVCVCVCMRERERERERERRRERESRSIF